MKLSALIIVLWAIGTSVGLPNSSRRQDIIRARKGQIYSVEAQKIIPKVFIITMFPPETAIWLDMAAAPGGIGSLLAQNITMPLASPLYPKVHCNKLGDTCILTTGEAEINAAVTITALLLWPQFDLRKTYFLVSGIAGINPNYGTVGDVAIAKYAVQAALQYEFDAREKPENFSTGYVPQGSTAPDIYPSSIYGTEVFELNEALRDQAANFTKGVALNDSATAVAFRKNYGGAASNVKATQSPSVRKCDVVTSDVYFSGTLLGDAMENTTRLFTNGSGVYCMTAQEDNATLEALIRGARAYLVDFTRIIVMRAASNFDRPYSNQSCAWNLFEADSGGFEPSLINLYLAGAPVVRGIIDGWYQTYSEGVQPKNYVGDFFASIGGIPDFGPGNGTFQLPPQPAEEKTYMKRMAMIKGSHGAEVARRANGKF